MLLVQKREPVRGAAKSNRKVDSTKPVREWKVH